LREKVSSEERKNLAIFFTQNLAWYSEGIGDEVYGNLSAVSFEHIARRH